MELYYCADLYEAAFLIVNGASFKKVEHYYKNNDGRGFSILSLEDVTYDMLERLYDPNSTVNFAKFREARKKLKQKIDKVSKTVQRTQLSSKQIYAIHKELKKQLNQWGEKYKSTGPKRVMQSENGEFESSTDKVPDVQANTLGSTGDPGIYSKIAGIL